MEANVDINTSDNNFIMQIKEAAELDLSSSGLTTAEITIIIKIAALSRSLKTLNLSNNKQGKDALAVMLELLKKLKGLHTLGLTKNELGEWHPQL